MPTLAISILLFSSCEKIIDIELNEAESTFVIEALLQKGTTNFTVSVTRTADYFDNALPQTIDNAVITLTNHLGIAINVPFKGNGIYQETITAVAEFTYQLDVAIDGETYTAMSYLPPVVVLDSLNAEYNEETPFSDEGYRIYCEFQDPVDQLNYYRFVQTINGELQDEPEDFFIRDDKIFDGNQIQLPLFGRVFQDTDTVSIEMRCMDRASYDYLLSLGELIGASQGPGGSAAPGNPATNWSGNILGYFSAYSSTSKTIILP